jgi:hypothetical protein
MKIKIAKGGPGRIEASPGAQTSVRQGDDELTGRALDNPEVKRFRETFGGQVRAVRNLKE